MSDITNKVVEAYTDSVVEATNKLEKDSIQFKQFIRDLVGDRLSDTECDELLVEQLKKATESQQQLKKLVDELLSYTKDANNKMQAKQIVTLKKEKQIVTLREENKRKKQNVDSGCPSVDSRVLSEVHSTDLGGQLEAADARTSSSILVTHPTEEIVTPGKLETGVDKLTGESSSPQEHDETKVQSGK